MSRAAAVIGGVVRPRALVGRAAHFFGGVWPLGNSVEAATGCDQDKIRASGHNICESDGMKIAPNRLERAEHVFTRRRSHFDPPPVSIYDAEAAKAALMRGERPRMAVVPPQRRPRCAISLVAVSRRSARGQCRGGAAPARRALRSAAATGKCVTPKAKRLKHAS
ncbi:MAG TPA: hypothetical protein VGJ20_10325 [Xanthobacteraceae bacterium]|jgi:hypothetical protein